MKLAFKDNFLGYFKFYQGVIGNKILINLCLGVLISFLDGLGLAMFIPLLQAVGENGAIADDHTSGNLRYFTDFIKSMGFDLTMTTILAFLVILFSLKGVIRFLQANYQVNVRHLFIKKIRFRLVESLRDLSYRGFLKLDAGKIQNTLTSEVQRLFQGMNYYLTAAQSMVMLLTYVALAFVANYQFAFLVAIGAGLSNFVFKRIYASTRKASLQLSKNGNQFNGFLIQSIQHFKYLKSTNYFSGFSDKLKKVIIKTEALNKKIGFYNAITSAVKEPLVIIIVVIVIFIQIRVMGSTMASIILSLLLFYRSLSFLMIVQTSWQNFIQTIGGMDAIARINAEMNDERETDNQHVFEGFSNRIELANVSFGYAKHKIINTINIKIEKNRTVALIGESGSGKTTLANLIAGLIPPSEGKLMVDGIDMTNLNLNSYRNKIGYISQEPVIFSDDIFNNITFWAERTKETELRFWNIVKLASLEDFILSQPEKELTLLGDNGIMISGGQKQRISIARELFKETEILILDEATSALDSETEKIIQDNIDKLHGSYTIIIIAHRLSTIKNADVIYLIEKGEILDHGTFPALLEKSSRFKAMISLQDFQ